MCSLASAKYLKHLSRFRESKIMANITKLDTKGQIFNEKTFKKIGWKFVNSEHNHVKKETQLQKRKIFSNIWLALNMV